MSGLAGLFPLLRQIIRPSNGRFGVSDVVTGPINRSSSACGQATSNRLTNLNRFECHSSTGGTRGASGVSMPMRGIVALK